MADVIIRGLSEIAIERIDAEACSLGLSRNEFLRRRLEGGAVAPAVGVSVTAEDWSRSAAAFEDLADPHVMESAWQQGDGCR